MIYQRTSIKKLTLQLKSKDFLIVLLAVFWHANNFVLILLGLRHFFAVVSVSIQLTGGFFVVPTVFRNYEIQ